MDASIDHRHGARSHPRAWRTLAGLLCAIGLTGALVVVDPTPQSARADDPTMGSDPGDFARIGVTLFFRADDMAGGAGLWRSDGTRAGTRLVRRLWPSELTAMGGRLWFFAESRSLGVGLWTSDGTTTGTRMIRAFDPADDFEGWDPVAGREPWTSDGTAAGTRRIKDIRPGRKASELVALTSIGGRLFFLAVDRTHGKELWVSDGTISGTRLVRDIRPGLESGFGCLNDHELAGIRGTVYFAANDGINGCELWRSDGSRAGTWMVKDIAQPS